MVNLADGDFMSVAEISFASTTRGLDQGRPEDKWNQ